MNSITLNKRFPGFAVLVLGMTVLSGVRGSPIVNGDFSAGDTGFSTDYTAVATNGTVHTNPQDYAVISNPSTAFTNGYDSYGDHTSGTGLMLFVDGSGDSTKHFWQEMPSLAPSTTYQFSYFVTGADSTSLPDVSVLVNGTAIDSGFQVVGVGGKWDHVTESFTTSAAGSYTLSMVDLNTTPAGNDFTVDDISLTRTSSSVPDSGSSAMLFAVALVGLGIARWSSERCLTTSSVRGNF